MAKRDLTVTISGDGPTVLRRRAEAAEARVAELASLLKRLHDESRDGHGQFCGCEFCMFVRAQLRREGFDTQKGNAANESEKTDISNREDEQRDLKGKELSDGE